MGFALELLSHYRISLIQRNKNHDFFSIAKARKKMLEDKFAQMHALDPDFLHVTRGARQILFLI
jgi:hypothetical protein